MASHTATSASGLESSRLSRWVVLLVAVACLGTLGCRGGAARGGAQFFDWPIPVGGRNDPRSLYSNLGEFRSPADSPFWLNHGATDFVAPRGTQVYSPDVGQVRFGEQSNRNAGQPPVKIGRFAMLHFRDVNNLAVNPVVLNGGRPTNAWTWVVNAGDPIWVRDAQGRPKQTALRRRQKSLPGIRQNAAGQWEDVFWYNRAFSIGEAGDEPDLHVIHYDTPDSVYGDRDKIRNMLRVIKYANRNPPEIQVVRFYSQKVVTGQAKERLLDSDAVAAGVMNIQRHGGVDIVVTCSSFKQSATSRAGIYKLAYAIHRFVGENEDPPPDAEQGPGRRMMIPVVAQTVMWTYDTLPTIAKDGNLVATNPVYPLPGPADISRFNLNASTQDKHTAYVATNTDGDDAAHWALEDTTRFPDGDYLVTITAWNIAASAGVGNAPRLGDRQVRLGVRVQTDGAGANRELRLFQP